ncbi:hypothetical protein F8M41_021611 [Gigaspora margarita]|uniref:Uncharacterized protein n=1 Tax=Gigaspora margarita TaxID=4874 RepID=A0A8H4EIU8_GIGMA|nr:hypothetical protein F8M41_021611 [Gigaspora margarita]
MAKKYRISYSRIVDYTDMISKILLKLKAIKYVSVTFSKTEKIIIYRINLDDLDYDRKEDDDYNVDSGQSWKNISGEKLEWEEENDYNEYINPGKRGEMLDQKYN